MGWQNCSISCKWDIGNGCNINFWDDVWLPDLTRVRSKIFGPLNKNENHLKIKNLIRDGTWSLNSISFCFPPDIELLIRSIHIPQCHNAPDKITWGLTSNSAFSVKSAYHMLNASSIDFNTPTPNFTWIWKINCPNKIKYFLWLCNHGKMKTSYHLHNIGIDISPLCGICSKPETIIHLFLDCPLVKKMWDELGMGAVINKIRDSMSPNWLKSLKNANCTSLPIDWKQAFPFFMWSIWLNRNRNFFDRTKVDINMKDALNRAFEYLLIGPNSYKGPKAKNSNYRSKIDYTLLLISN